MVPCDDEEDERLLKSGPDLFKELLRVYPVAEWEDYFKAGQWRDELMKTDLQLIDAHRLEAGAPDPPPLDEVKLPELPRATPAPTPKLPGLSGLMNVRGQMKAPSPAGGQVAGSSPKAAVAVAAAESAQAADLRLITLFVAKWKIDATKTKLALAKLHTERRRHVIQNFKATAAGEEANAELQTYIEECEKTEAWGPLAPNGVKRPADGGPEDPSKKPKASAANPMAQGKSPALAAALSQQTAPPTPKSAMASAKPAAVGLGLPKATPKPGPKAPGPQPKAGLLMPKKA